MTAKPNRQERAQAIRQERAQAIGQISQQIERTERRYRELGNDYQRAAGDSAIDAMQRIDTELNHVAEDLHILHRERAQLIDEYAAACYPIN